MAKISFVKNLEVAFLQQIYTGSYLLQGTPNSRVEASFRLGFTIAAGRRCLTSLPLPIWSRLRSRLRSRPLDKLILTKFIKPR
jgi:hypothetical protein